MSAASRPVSSKVLIASVAGSAIEWFDYFLYGAFASLVFNKLFFPAEDPTVSLLLTYGAFALTFFVRPLGGVIFAHLGDRLGRKKSLVFTLGLMGIGTGLIGVLPTYEQVGILAPILLTLLRIVQGIGIGGEWGGALLLAYEYAPAERKGLYGSLPQAGVPIGMLLATACAGIVATLPDQQFFAWGWRIPFLVSVCLVLLGLWIRRGVDETPEFKALQKTERVARSPLRQILKEQRREIAVTVLAKVVETASFYIFTVFVIGYVTDQLGYPKNSMLNVLTLSALVTVVAIPLMGRLSDSIGRKNTFLLGCLAIAVVTPVYFMLLDQRNVWALLLASVLALGIAWPIVTAVLGTLFSEMFSPEVRYTGVSLGYQIGAALAGGTAPLIAVLLQRKFHGWGGIAVYVIGTAILSAVAVLVGGRVAARRGVSPPGSQKV
ncbi:MAG: MFS transporter [Steroidobacteraceae bacterium]